MPPGKPTPLSTKNSKRQPSKPKPQDDGLDVAMSTRVDWKDNTLTWSIITAIEDDEKIRSGLFPGPGKTPSTANGGGKAKTDWYYQIAEKTFKDHEEYSEPFAKATSAKAKAKWSEKIKNRLDKLSKLTIEHIRTLDKTGEGIQCEADIWECDNQFVNKWREVKASFPWFFEMRDLVGSRPNRINDHLLGNSGTIGTTIPDFDTEDPSSVDDDIDTYSDVLRDETDIKSDVDVSDPPLATATPSLKRKVKSEDASA
ncbi:hypothetical protein DENSPDRAFT_669018 [Dentipellis sp. KUC8613]|nr:hypothetical protein DENSPDRAFT_669018 [Dentipellis sp. KUC8613]